MQERKTLDEEWVATTLFSKLDEDIDDGLTTTLWRYARVVGITIEEARALAAAMGAKSSFLKFWTDRKGRDLVRMNRESRERNGLLVAIGVGSRGGSAVGRR